jgi:hypothetical protein
MLDLFGLKIIFPIKFPMIGVRFSLFLKDIEVEREKIVHPF